MYVCMYVCLLFVCVCAYMYMYIYMVTTPLTRFWLGFFMDVKWLGRGKNYPPPPPHSSYLKNETS